MKTLETLLKNTRKEKDCLIWLGLFNTDGYPRIYWNGSSNGKVHRIIYTLVHPEENIAGKHIRHTCDNPKCINPNHLLSGTPEENIQDRCLRNRTYKKITKEIVLTCLALLQEGKLSQKEIAQYLQINPRRVSDINCGIYDKDARLTRYL